MFDTLVLTSLLGIVIMVLEMLKARNYIVQITVILLLGILANHLFGNATQDSFNNMLAVNDAVSHKFITLLLCIAIPLIMMSYHHYKQGQKLSDFIVLKVFILSGAIAMVYFQNILVFFIGLEILSIGLYTLSTSDKKNLLSNEAGMKYFITGSFATAIFLLGMTLIYAHTGTFDLQLMSQRMQMTSENMTMLMQIGLFLMIVALLFKTSVAPFHLWSPDVYQGAPIITTATLSTLSKVAAIGALFRFAYYALHHFIDKFPTVLITISIISMLVGSIAAVRQTNIKRILAFSGISNAGFMLIPVIFSHSQTAISTILMYATAYSLGSLAVISIAIGLVQKNYPDSYKMFNGLAKRNPFVAIFVTVGLLSLAGIPPLLGFFAKYNVIVLAIQNHILLVIVAIIASVISLFVYFRIIWAIYLEEPERNEEIHTTKFIVAAASALALVLLTIFANWVF